MKHNPWVVEDITAFLFYNCPECDLKEKDPEKFKGHAIENHERAKISLEPTVEILDDFVQDAFDIDDKIPPSEPTSTSEEPRSGVKRELENVLIKEDNEPVIKKLCIDIKSQCYICGAVFFGENSNDLQDSILAHICGKHGTVVTPKMYGKVRDYQCYDCLRMFASKESLDIHVCGVVPSSWLGADKKTQNCPECDKPFEDYGQLLFHFKEEHRKEQAKYKCVKNSCSLAEFSSRSDLSDHVKGKHRLQCKHCYKHYYSDSMFHIHETSCYGDGLPLFYTNECAFCCLRYKTKQELEQHQEMRHKRVMERLKIKCTYCDFVTTTRWLLQHHKKQAHPVTCQVCLKNFKNPTLLVEHLDRAHGKEKSILCEQCDFRCHSMANLEKHKRRVHDKERNYPCQYCDKSFFDANDRTEHIKKLHSNNGQLFKCPKCDKEFKSKQQRRTHIRFHHEKFASCTRCEKMFCDGFQKLRDHLEHEHQSYYAKDDLWLCPKCNQRFQLTKELDDHLNQEHSMSKDHDCSKCNEAFVSKSLLANHLYEVHDFDPMKETDEHLPIDLEPKKVIKDTSDRQFKCEHCDAYLKSTRTLNDHIKQVHQKEFHTHFCTECDWSTYEAFKLKQHYIVQHTEKHMKCDHCDRKFSSQTILKQHMRTKHLKKNHVSCPECDKNFINKKLLANHCLNEHQVLMTLKPICNQ